MQRKDYSLIGETVYTEKLANGLTILTVPKHGFNKYFAYFAVNYGAIDRRFKLMGHIEDTPPGVAHFLEHKMFDTAEGDAMTMLSANGASSNAYTSPDITAYHFDCVDKFYQNLEILLGFVSTPYFMPESIEREKGIITQEILMSDDDPDYCLYYGLMKSLFKSSPLRDSVAGTIDSISEITVGTLETCHKTFYNPSNMVLCVAGNIDPSEVAAAAQSILPPTPVDVPVRDYGPQEDLQPVKKLTTKEMDVSLPLFLAGCKIPPVDNGPGALLFELVGAIVMEILAGHSSPLYFKLYDEGLVSSDFSASIDDTAGAAYMLFGGETRDPDRVFNEVIKEIRKVAESGCDPKLFERIKKAAIGSHIRMLNSFDAICSSLSGGYFRGYNAFEAPMMVSKITDSDVSSFAREYLIPGNMAISVINPKVEV